MSGIASLLGAWLQLGPSAQFGEIHPKGEVYALDANEHLPLFNLGNYHRVSPELHGRPLHNIWLEAALADTLGEHFTQLKEFPDGPASLVQHIRPRHN